MCRTIIMITKKKNTICNLLLFSLKICSTVQEYCATLVSEQQKKYLFVIVIQVCVCVCVCVCVFARAHVCVCVWWQQMSSHC